MISEKQAMDLFIDEDACCQGQVDVPRLIKYIFNNPNEKQQIAEAERRFENWWDAEGYDRWLESEEVATQDRQLSMKRLLKEAWMNGAFVARENN